MHFTTSLPCVLAFATTLPLHTLAHLIQRDIQNLVPGVPAPSNINIPDADCTHGTPATMNSINKDLEHVTYNLRGGQMIGNNQDGACTPAASTAGSGNRDPGDARTGAILYICGRPDQQITPDAFKEAVDKVTGKCKDSAKVSGSPVDMAHGVAMSGNGTWAYVTADGNAPANAWWDAGSSTKYKIHREGGSN